MVLLLLMLLLLLGYLEGGRRWHVEGESPMAIHRSGVRARQCSSGMRVRVAGGGGLLNAGPARGQRSAVQPASPRLCVTTLTTLGEAALAHGLRGIAPDVSGAAGQAGQRHSHASSSSSSASVLHAGSGGLVVHAGVAAVGPGGGGGHDGRPAGIRVAAVRHG